MGRAFALMEEEGEKKKKKKKKKKKNLYRILLGTPAGKRPLGRQKRVGR
jgi:hypothetical protein